MKNCLELQFSPASQKLRAARSRRLKNEKWPRRCRSWFPKLLRKKIEASPSKVALEKEMEETEALLDIAKAAVELHTPAQSRP